MGFCYLYFQDHTLAKKALKKLMSSPLNRFESKELVADWAVDCFEKPFNCILVNNLDRKTTYEQMNAIFSKYGKIERFRLIDDHAYIYFRESIDAAVAKEELNLKLLNGNRIQIHEKYDGRFSGGEFRARPSSSSSVRPSHRDSSPAMLTSRFDDGFDSNNRKRKRSRSTSRQRYNNNNNNINGYSYRSASRDSYNDFGNGSNGGGRYSESRRRI
jgi:RNA recognition motif-containing protein